MKISFIALGVLLASVAAAFVMSDIHVSYTLHVKTTVVVETPEGEVSGSAVREISNSASSISLGWTMATNAPDIRGEAVVVDLGERGTLFSLISDGTDYEMYQVFPTPKIPETSLEGIKYYKKTLKPGMKGELNPNERPGYPALVTFTDMNNPKSVTLVRGYVFHPETQTSELENHFEELFGEGVSLKAIELEVTKEPVTKKIDAVLPWLSTVKKGSLDGRLSGGGPELSNILHYGNFKKGEKQ